MSGDRQDADQASSSKSSRRGRSGTCRVLSQMLASGHREAGEAASEKPQPRPTALVGPGRAGDGGDVVLSDCVQGPEDDLQALRLPYRVRIGPRGLQSQRGGDDLIAKPVYAVVHYPSYAGGWVCSPPRTKP